MGGPSAGGLGEVGRVVLVVARHDEDAGWVESFPGEVAVVQKGRDLPNVGREASSWLWYLETATIVTDATYAFLQGDPRPHGVIPADIRRVDAFTPIGAVVYTCGHDGQPNHPGLPLAGRAREWFGTELPSEVTFRAGAMFLAPGRLLLTRSSGWYADLRRKVERDEFGPWLMERMWALVWGQSLAGIPASRDLVPGSPSASPLPPPDLRVRRLLGQGDPYAGLVDAAPPDLSGWTQPNLQDVAARLLRDAKGDAVVVEVGSWKGRSAVELAAAVARTGTPCEIVCVDTWLGSPEFWGPGTHENHDLQRERGYPRVYETFLRNIAASGLAGVVTPFPISSAQGAVVLERLGIRPRLVYLDASHEEDAVVQDCGAWWPLLPPGGALLGDDWGPDWPGVEAGVRAWASSCGILQDAISVDGRVWWLRKT